MLNPPPTIKFLRLRVCFVKIRGPTPSNRPHAAIATQSNRTAQYTRHRTSVDFKLAVALWWVALQRVHLVQATAYRISSNRMHALYSFQCFKSARIIRGRSVFEGALYFLSMNSCTGISPMKIQTGSSSSQENACSYSLISSIGASTQASQLVNFQSPSASVSSSF